MRRLVKTAETRRKDWFYFVVLASSKSLPWTKAWEDGVYWELTAYFLDPHMRSTTRMLYSVMAAMSTSAELV